MYQIMHNQLEYIDLIYQFVCWSCFSLANSTSSAGPVYSSMHNIMTMFKVTYTVYNNYMPWYSVIYIYIIITYYVIILQRKKIKTTPDNGNIVNARKKLRRFLIFLLLLWYAPATQLSLRSYICESNIPLVRSCQL